MIDADVKITEIKIRGFSPILIGVKSPKAIFGEKKEPQQSIGSYRVATEDRGKVFKPGLTDAKSLESVWKKTKLKTFFERQIKRDFYIFATIWAEELKNDKNKVKRANLNTASAILKKAYLNMATTYSASIRRQAIKGHRLFAIGTGQTLKAIKAWFKESDSAKVN